MSSAKWGKKLATKLGALNEGSSKESMQTLANWIVFVIGKMIGAFVVSDMIRRRENAGITDPYEDIPAQSSMV